MENPLESTGSKTQGLNDHAQVSQPQDQDGLTEEVSKIQDSTEQPEDSTPQDLSGQVQEIKAQDLKDWVKEQLAIETTIETLEQQQPVDMEVYSSRRSSISHPQKMTMTTRDDVPSSPLPELSLDDGTLLKEADNELQGLQELLEERRKTLMETPDQLEERRKTLMMEIDGLEERRKTLMEITEELEEKRKTLMEASEELEERQKTLVEIPEQLEERRKTLMEESDGLEERRKALMETIEGLEERRKTLMEVPEGLRERRKTVIEIPEGHGERRKTVIEIQEGLGERRTVTEAPEELGEIKKTLTEIPEPRFQEDWSGRKYYQSPTSVPRKASKKHKPEPPRVPSKPSSLFSWPPKTRYIPPKPKPETADKSTQLRAIPVFPLRLTAPINMPRIKTHAPKSETKSTIDSGTQISRSFERLMKKPPLPLNKKKKSKYKTMSKITSSDTASSFSKDSRQHKSGVDRILKKKCQDIDRFSRSQKKCTALERVSWSQSKLTNPHVIYNFYVNVCDCCREVDPCDDFPPCNWKECEPCAGLSRACAVFSNLKRGGICVSDLFMTLHTLGILVTHNEMQQALKCIRMDDGMVDFTEFLELVNQTSPFADTDALQNALRAFRKIKKGQVPVRDLESVLENLGVEMSYADMRQILKNPRVCKVDKVDLSNFFMAAKELGSLIENEEICPADCTIWERKPFQDVSNLVSANSRWRRKYDSCDEDICGPWTCSDDDIDTQSERLSWIPIAVTSVTSEESDERRPSITVEITPPADDVGQGESSTAPAHNEDTEHKEGDIGEVVKSPADVANQEKPKTEPIHNTEAEKKEGDIVTRS